MSLTLVLMLVYFLIMNSKRCTNIQTFGRGKSGVLEKPSAKHSGPLEVYHDWFRIQRTKALSREGIARHHSEVPGKTLSVWRWIAASRPNLVVHKQWSPCVTSCKWSTNYTLVWVWLNLIKNSAKNPKTDQKMEVCVVILIVSGQSCE